MIIDHTPVDVEIIQSVRTANVALKMTYEFNELTTTELIENITYDMILSTLGSITVDSAPKLTVFEPTGMIYVSISIQCKFRSLIVFLQISDFKIF